MTTEDRLIKVSDGYELAATEFDGGNITKSHVMIIASAAGTERTIYEAFAAFLANQGVQVITFDYRGIGESLHTPIRSCTARMSDWGKKDLAGVLAWAKKRYPKAHITVLAHSAGGQILPLATNRRLIDSIILVGAQSEYWKLWPLRTRYLLLLMWTVVMPVLTILLGYMPNRFFGLGENLPKWIAREWGHWCRHKDYIARDEPELVYAQFASLKVPMLAYSFWDDWIAPKGAVDTLVSWYSSTQLTRRHIGEKDTEYHYIGHYGFFREHHKRTMWEMGVLAWLKKLPKKETRVRGPSTSAQKASSHS